MGTGRSVNSVGMASAEYTSHDHVAPSGACAEAKNGRGSNELTALMQGLMGAQANDSGWPAFSGRYVEYPRFRKEWWAYRQTYHGHMRDELVCRSLKEKSLASGVRMLVNDIDDLREAWNTLDTCFDRPENTLQRPWTPSSSSEATRHLTKARFGSSTPYCGQP
jgi:hypothetical protein